MAEEWSLLGLSRAEWCRMSSQLASAFQSDTIPRSSLSFMQHCINSRKIVVHKRKLWFDVGTKSFLSCQFACYFTPEHGATSKRWPEEEGKQLNTLLEVLLARIEVECFDSWAQRPLLESSSRHKRALLLMCCQYVVMCSMFLSIFGFCLADLHILKARSFDHWKPIRRGGGLAQAETIWPRVGPLWQECPYTFSDSPAYLRQKKVGMGRMTMSCF